MELVEVGTEDQTHHSPWAPPLTGSSEGTVSPVFSGFPPPAADWGHTQVSGPFNTRCLVTQKRYFVVLTVTQENIIIADHCSSHSLMSCFLTALDIR